MPEFSANFRPLIARIAITRIPSALAPFPAPFRRRAPPWPALFAVPPASRTPARYPARRPPRRTPRRRPAARRPPRPPPRPPPCARPRPHPRPQAGGRLIPDLYTCLQHTSNHQQETIYIRTNRPAPHSSLLFYGLYPVSVWESAGGFITATACAFARCGGFRCRQVPVMEPALAGGAECGPDRDRAATCFRSPGGNSCHAVESGGSSTAGRCVR